MMEKVFIEDRDALIKLLGADWVVCQHMRNGGKQNKIIEEVKRDRTRPLKSLKKIKYCKKTKGEHEFVWKTYYRTIQIETCKLCGKRGKMRVQCDLCGAFLTHWRHLCDGSKCIPKV